MRSEQFLGFCKYKLGELGNFRTCPLLEELLGNLALETETELDDLVVPYAVSL